MTFTRNHFEDTLRSSAQSLIRTLEQLVGGNVEALWAAIVELRALFERDGRLLVCGNGGSAADAQHFAGELVATFGRGLSRRALSVIALPSDMATITALANDFGYEHVFSRQVEAHGRAGDYLLAISTSGASRNVVEAAKAASRCDMKVISITGEAGKTLQQLSDLSIVIPSTDTQVIQNTYQFLLHILCFGVEESMDSDRAR